MDKKYIFALSFLLLTTGQTFAQTLNQARLWFENKQYAEAKPVFKKMVKQSPTNANYNFWYGACCYETGDLKEAQPYLEKSAEKKVINAYLYLGKLYFKQYRFDDAVSNLETHIGWLEKKKIDTSSAERELDRCRKAARMIRATENITVVDSFVVDKSTFLSAYKLSKESGTITMLENGDGTSFTNELNDKMIFPQEGKDGDTYLYNRIKLIDKWSDSEQLKGLSDVGESMNYPFLDSDGITLYYAAEGDESLGGYDIFVTRYDSDSNSYLKPDNIGMPFNSIYNDYMYAIDDLNNLGWFASDRFQPKDKVCVYVFVPNDSKVVYDYENMSDDKIIAAATLSNIKSTQSNADKFRIAKQQLAQLMYSGNNTQKKEDFRFVINDNLTYTTISDFHSKEAAKIYLSLQQKEKDLSALCTSLEKQRETYRKAIRSEKQKLTLGILDQENRIKELRKEIETSTRAIRNTEIKSRNK